MTIFGENLVAVSPATILTILNLRKEKIGFQFWFNQLRLTASEWLLMPINVE